MRRLELAGFQVMRSFDLKVARAAHLDCTCPHHGTDKCDCQLVVLLVYAKDGPPVTLVIHGHDGQVQVALAETPGQQPSAQVVNTIRAALAPAGEPADKRGRKAASLWLGEDYHAG